MKCKLVRLALNLAGLQPEHVFGLDLVSTLPDSLIKEASKAVHTLPVL